MELESCPRTLQRVEVDRYVDPAADWQTGFWLQYSTLTRRNFRRQRGRYFSKLLFGQMLFLAVVTGFVWFDMERSEDMARDRLGMVITQLYNYTSRLQCMQCILYSYYVGLKFFADTLPRRAAS